MKSAYRCGDCRFYSCEKQFDKVCEQLGHLDSSIGCDKFKPNPKKLKDALNETDSVMDLIAELVSKVPASSLHVLSSLVYNEKTTRKFGYRFMQKVYVRYRGVAGADYVSNFMPAYIVEASKNGLRLMSPNGNTHILKTEFKKGELSGPNIFSISEWKIQKRKMLSEDRIEDPALKRKKVSQSYLLEEQQIEKTEESKRKKKYPLNDLVTMTQDIEKGYKISNSYKRKVSPTYGNNDSIVIR